MGLEINLGDIDRIKDCCTGDYLLHPDSLQLYRIVKRMDLKTIFIVDVETAIVKVCVNNLTELKKSAFYNNLILIPESEFELIKK